MFTPDARLTQRKLAEVSLSRRTLAPPHHVILFLLYNRAALASLSISRVVYRAMTESATVNPEKVRTVYERLVETYGPRSLRPGRDPLDELILTILSQNTSDRNSGRAYRLLRAKYPTWEQVIAAPLPELYEVIKPAGLGNIKAPRIQNTLHAILERRGELSLDFLDALPQDGGVRTAVRARQAGAAGRYPRPPRREAAGADRPQSQRRSGAYTVGGRAAAGVDLSVPYRHDPARPAGVPCPTAALRDLPTQRSVRLLPELVMRLCKGQVTYYAIH